jgi:hypothetical protein
MSTLNNVMYGLHHDILYHRKNYRLFSAALLNSKNTCLCMNSKLVLSEEFPSRVAESTRLILVKDGFGGDLGALGRWADEHRKDTKI